MSQTLGALKLSPIKEDGRFIFLNTEIRINTKVSKGDYIQIRVIAYRKEGQKHLLNSDESPQSKMVVRGGLFTNEYPPGAFLTIEDLYASLCDEFRQLFYFGKK